MQNQILVVDIETSGFLNQGGKIVEIGMVLLDMGDGSVKPLYESLKSGAVWSACIPPRTLVTIPK